MSGGHGIQEVRGSIRLIYAKKHSKAFGVEGFFFVLQATCLKNILVFKLSNFRLPTSLLT